MLRRKLVLWSRGIPTYLREMRTRRLAVARIARDDGSSSVLQMGMTNYQPLRSYAVTHFIPNQTWLGISYALFRYAHYTAFYTSAVTQYTYDVAPF